MIQHPNFNPILLDLGKIQIHWYGVMYLLGFLGVYLAANRRVKKLTFLQKIGWSKERISDLIFYGALGVILGGRLGYVLFYNPLLYLANPFDIIKIYQGGMSFHGGLLGVMIAIALFARKYRLQYLAVCDFIAPLACIGLFFGRIANFINQELWGKPSDLPWAMVFPNIDAIPRHPSMLYEAILEGIVLGCILWAIAKKPRKIGVLSGLFLVGYSVARMFVELVRIPDAHLDYLLWGWVTMGHILSLPMFVIGVFLLQYRFSNEKK